MLAAASVASICLKTSNWELASKRVHEAEARGTWELPLGACQQRKAIKQAIDRFLEDRASRVSPTTVYKYEICLRVSPQRLTYIERLTPQEVEHILSVKHEWIKDHTTRIEPIIPHIRMGRTIRFRRADIQKFLAAQVTSKPTWDR
jgi:hypothetical protein